MQLPTEIVRQVAEYLDGVSLCSFVDAYPEFPNLLRGSGSLERIRVKNLNDRILMLLSPVTPEVRSLDLSQCFSDPDLMTRLIRKCLRLSRLNVMNSSLSIHLLGDAIEGLTELSEIGLTTLGTLLSNFAGGPKTRKIYLSIQKVSVESSLKGILLVPLFLRMCPNAKHLHISIVEQSTQYNKVPWEWDLSGPIFRRRWGLVSMDRFDGVILSAYMPHAAPNLRPFLVHVFHPNEVILSSNSTKLFSYERRPTETEDGNRSTPQSATPFDSYRTLYIERKTTDGELEIPNSYQDKTMTALWVTVSPRIGYVKMPRMETLSSLVELDVSECHLEYYPGFWPCLVQSSPAIEALALPQCALLKTSLGSDRKISAIIEETMNALRRLRLKKLYVSACNSCFRYHGSDRRLWCGFLKGLADFRYVEEFSLRDAEAESDFFDDFGDRSFAMRTVSLEVAMDDMSGLGKFIRACTKLRNLKLEAYGLPIRSGWFWDTVIAANLKQLCLSSASGMPIDTQMLRQKLSHLFRSLEVFHLHAKGLSNLCDVEKVVAEEANTANLHREMNPIAHALVNTSSIAEDPVGNLLRPGRALCGMQNHIAKPVSMGWDID